MNPRPQIILYIIIIIVIISLMALAARWLPRQGRAQHVPKIWGSWYASFLRYARRQIHRYADCSTNAALRRRWHSWQHGSRRPWSIAKGRPVASTRTHTYLLTYLRFTHTLPGCSVHTSRVYGPWIQSSREEHAAPYGSRVMWVDSREHGQWC